VFVRGQLRRRCGNASLCACSLYRYEHTVSFVDFRRVAMRPEGEYTQPHVAGCVRFVTLVCSLLPKCRIHAHDQVMMMLHVLPLFLASLTHCRVAVV